MKAHYRQRLVKKLILSVEAGIELKISVLDAMHWLRCAWDNVTPTTIRNCFFHCNFNVANSENDLEFVANSRSVNAEFEDLFQEFRSRDSDVVSFEDYTDIDNDTEIDGAFTDEEIVRMVQVDQLEEADILDEELEEDAAITCPSTMKFRSASDIVKSYVLFHSEYSHIAAIDSLEEPLYTRIVKQSSITDLY